MLSGETSYFCCSENVLQSSNFYEFCGELKNLTLQLDAVWWDYLYPCCSETAFALMLWV